MSNTYPNTNTNSNSNSNSNNRFTFKEIMNADSLRKRYIIQFVILIIMIIILYIYNPFGIFTTYAGPTIFISLFLGMFLITMIVFYDYLFKHPGLSNVPKDLSSNIFFILFAFLISAGLILLLLWCLGFFSANSNASSSTSIISLIINFLLLFVMLSIVYKILSLSAIGKFPLTRVILYSVLYIPCLFVNLIEMIMNEYHKTTKSIVILLLLEIVLFLLYIYIPIITASFYTQGGKQLINHPLSLSNAYDIGTYQTLNDSDDYSYQYAISFWFNIDAMSPSINKNYSYYTNILTYGDNPCIQYNAKTNSLLITVKSNTDNTLSVVDITHQLESKITSAQSKDEIDNIQNQIKQTINKVNTIPLQTEHDNKGQRIIYKNKNVLLQKWNNLIINYNGGTLDVFLNGELVKSSIGVVSYITYDTLTVGQINGISGGVANLIYYKQPLDIFKIQKLYNKMKDKNPPSTNDNNKTIV